MLRTLVQIIKVWYYQKMTSLHFDAAFKTRKTTVMPYILWYPSLISHY